MEKKLPVKDVKVGKRIRKDYGDVKGLAETIERVGLIQAIAVTKEKRLIDGERRLKAVKSLKQPTIDCRIVQVADLMEAEGIANEFAKSLTPTEKANFYQAMAEDQGGVPGKGNREPKAKHKRPGGGYGGNGKPKKTKQRLAIEAGFTSHQELDRVSSVAEKGSAELVKALDANKIKVTKAAEIAELPKQDQAKILKDAKQEDGTYKFTKPSAVKKKGPSVSDVWLGRLDEHIATVNGLREKHKTIAGLFDSKAWQRKENKERIGEFVDKVQILSGLFSDLDSECSAYCRKHDIE